MGGRAQAVRELLVVVAVAVAGLLLAMLAAFSPWHPGSGDGQADVIELHSPYKPVGSGEWWTGSLTAVAGHR